MSRSARIDDPRILLLLPIALFARMALNAIDGMLAREHAQQSKLGAILDEPGDVVGGAAMYLPLALRPVFPVAATVVFVLLGVIAEMTGVIGVQIAGAAAATGRSPPRKSTRTGRDESLARRALAVRGRRAIMRQP